MGSRSNGYDGLGNVDKLDGDMEGLVNGRVKGS